MRKTFGKYITFAFITTMILTGCSEKDSTEHSDKSSDTATEAPDNKAKCNTKEIVEEMEKVLELPQMIGQGKSTVEEQEAMDTFEYLCDIDYEKVMDYYISCASDSSADEIFVIEFDSNDSAKDAQKFLDERIERRRKQFETYKAEEVPVFDDAVVEREKNYLALIVNEGADDAAEKFKDLIG